MLMMRAIVLIWKFNAFARDKKTAVIYAKSTSSKNKT